ncbi:MAG: hypothetical protein ACLQPV_05285 [Vulcanimicrobiaceae bacterium]
METIPVRPWHLFELLPTSHGGIRGIAFAAAIVATLAGQFVNPSVATEPSGKATAPASFASGAMLCYDF